MSEKDWKCGHTCRNSCSMLNEALRKETASVRFYESVLDECHTPEIRQMVMEMIERRRLEVMSMIQKLNEIHARSQALDGIASSFGS